jgi:predicted transcriptional regulator
MENQNKSFLNRFKTLTEHNEIIHFFKLIGNEEEVNKLAKEKALELKGEYYITKNYSKTSINVIISYPLNLDWDSQRIAQS